MKTGKRQEILCTVDQDNNKEIKANNLAQTILN
jgi:hypothetical protein